MDTLTVEEQVEQVLTPVEHEPSKSDPSRRWSLWIAIVGVVCLISGAALFVLGGSDPAPPPPAVTSAAEAADRAFEEFVTDEGLTRYGDVAMLMDAATNVCGAFDQGHEWATVLGILLDGGYTAYDAGAFIGASVAAYCPEHADVSP